MRGSARLLAPLVTAALCRNGTYHSSGSARVFYMRHTGCHIGYEKSKEKMDSVKRVMNWNEEREESTSALYREAIKE